MTVRSKKVKMVTTHWKRMTKAKTIATKPTTTGTIRYWIGSTRPTETRRTKRGSTHSKHWTRARMSTKRMTTDLTQTKRMKRGTKHSTRATIDLKRYSTGLRHYWKGSKHCSTGSTAKKRYSMHSIRSMPTIPIESSCQGNTARSTTQAHSSIRPRIINDTSSAGASVSALSSVTVFVSPA